MYIRMYVRMCLCVCLCMCLCMYVHTYVRMCVSHVCTYVCFKYLHMYCMYVRTHVGVGNVCSYAEMSIRRHGDPRWNTFGPGGGGEGSSVPRPSAAEQGEMGKTEMSLLQFKVRTALQTQ